jgi:site-specific recombinase XerD
VGKLFRDDNGRLRYLSHDEYDRLIEAAKTIDTSPYLEEKIVLAVHTGVRRRSLLCSTGESLTMRLVQGLVASAARRAGLTHTTESTSSGTHSVPHLAMLGAGAKAIQELAGHSELGTTQRYMHVSPNVTDSAIQLLDALAARGAQREAEIPQIANSFV